MGFFFSGFTGSGATTQLPAICMGVGLSVSQSLPSHDPPFRDEDTKEIVQNAVNVFLVPKSTECYRDVKLILYKPVNVLLDCVLYSR